MSRSKAIAVLFYLGAVVIGAALGIAVDRRVVRDRIDNVVQNPREHMYAYLDLSPVQRASWDSIRGARAVADSILTAPIWAQMRPQLQALAAQRDSLRHLTTASLRALLTAEQLELYDARQAQEQAQRQRSNDGRR
jgi:hypothetical protein